MGWEKLGGALEGIEADFVSRKRRQMMSPNPHTHPMVRSGGFFSGNEGRLLSGWDTASYSIDYYLESELRQLRARSRKMVRANPFGKRFISAIKSNVVGPKGCLVQAQSKILRDGTMVLDTPANDAIEEAFRDWGRGHCDYTGRHTWIDLQNLAISSAAQDGEFIFHKMWGKAAGKYGFQLRSMDPELLDVEKNTLLANGNEVRLGVEYDKQGRVVRYHFRKRNRQGNYAAGYSIGESYSLPAREILHGFITEWPDQSRGIPWMHSSIERSKHLEKYDEAAVVAARLGASTMTFLKSQPGDEYTGDEDGEGEYADATLDHYDPGTIKDIGTRDIANFDPDYPHQMYADFVKSQLRGIASGLGISYHLLSNDLEGVNYSSIRAGVLDDREVYKGLQEWFIRSLVCPVYEEWISMAVMGGAIKLGTRPLARPVSQYLPAAYQPKRWDWVDPQKDGTANDMAIANRTKSRGQIIRDSGGDPDTLWREIAREEQMLRELGIEPIEKMPQQQPKEAADDE